MPNNLPDGINRDHILQAIQDLDDGLEHRFAGFAGFVGFQLA